MRIYSNAYELMSETGRNLWEMGLENCPKTYQNKKIEGDDNFITKELICEQYCLTKLPDPESLFVHTKSAEWAKAELEERLIPEGVNPGAAWELRKDVWEEFLVNGKFDYSYGERMNKRFWFEDGQHTAIQEVISLLIRDNDTRKAILPIYSGEDTKHLIGDARIPCSMYYDFLIRTNVSGNKQLNICYHQRSSDFITHFGNDVFLAWGLMEYIAGQVGVKPGYLYHTIDSLHAYKKDWVVLKNSLSQMI